MTNIFIALALLAVTVYASPTPVPTAEQAKAELIAAGVSETVAQGIIDIAQKYKDQFAAAKTDPEAGKTAFKQFHAEVDTYIKTQSEADQTAYAAFIEKKKAEHQARKAEESA